MHQDLTHKQRETRHNYIGLKQRLDLERRVKPDNYRRQNCHALAKSIRKEKPVIAAQNELEKLNCVFNAS